MVDCSYCLVVINGKIYKWGLVKKFTMTTNDDYASNVSIQGINPLKSVLTNFQVPGSKEIIWGEYRPTNNGLSIYFLTDNDKSAKDRLTVAVDSILESEGKKGPTFRRNLKLNGLATAVLLEDFDCSLKNVDDFINETSPCFDNFEIADVVYRETA
jgi:hypothetical protein